MDLNDRLRDGMLPIDPEAESVPITRSTTPKMSKSPSERTLALFDAEGREPAAD